MVEIYCKSRKLKNVELNRTHWKVYKWDILIGILHIVGVVAFHYPITVIWAITFILKILKSH
jgi:hypothetical protein